MRHAPAPAGGGWRIELVMTPLALLDGIGIEPLIFLALYAIVVLLIGPRRRRVPTTPSAPVLWAVAEADDAAVVNDGSARQHATTVSRPDPASAPEKAQIEGRVRVLVPHELPRFADVAGPSTQRRQLEDTAGVVLGGGPGFDRPCTGVLLLGPTGSGRSLHARALAGRHGVPLITVRARHLLVSPATRSRIVNEAIVRFARRSAPCVLCIEDLDVLLGTGDVAPSAGNRALHDLRSAVATIEPGERVAVLATSSVDVPPSLAADGGFDHPIVFGRPDAQVRGAIVRDLMADTGSIAADAVSELVRGSDGTTTGELVELLGVARRYATQDASERIHIEHVHAALRAPRAPQQLADLVLDPELRNDLDELAKILSDPRATVGVVLAGSRGAGTTTIARCLATSAYRTAQRVTLAGTQDTGDVARWLDDALDMARRHRPSVLLLDDLDAVWTSPARGTALVERPRLAAVVEHAIDRALATPGVSVVATAHRLDRIPETARSADRLRHSVWVPRLDGAGRLALLRDRLAAVELVGITRTALAAQLHGCSTAQVHDICADLVRSGRHRRLRAPGDPPHVVVEASDVWDVLGRDPRSAA